VKIKRLEILGFKSFVDKVSIDFQQPITGIVGPNGCGKSNIVDAIRWGMGEQSAKNLRGKSMEDVIFGGSESRKPLGMAEVSLLFTTEDSIVPAKYLNYSEIQVTRRLYRDGESEYYLNKTPCRLLDIAELFMDTGVGNKAYSIIEQGKIGTILHSKPEERRFLIEEAAGVTKFKARKQVALRKIEHTRQNLLRLGDIISEIRRQVNSLQRQAKKAEKFKVCREELREIEQFFSVRSWESLEEEQKNTSQTHHEAATRLERVTAELERGELRLEEQRISLMEEEQGVTRAQEEAYRIKGDLQTVENRLEFQRKEQTSLGGRKLRLEEELSGLERQKEEALREQEGLEAHRGEYDNDIQADESRLLEGEEALEELTRTELGLSRRLEESRRELFDLLSQIAQINNAQSGATRRLEAMADRFHRHHRENVQLQERLVDSMTRCSGLELDLAGQQRLREEQLSRLEEIREQEALLKREFHDTEQELNRQRNLLSGRTSRLQSLRELEKSLTGYGQGVKTLLRAERFTGRFRGVLADLVETGEAHETALEAALGERLQYLVTAGGGDARDAITFLREEKGGRSSFVFGAPAFSFPRNLPGNGIELRSLVTVNPEFHSLVEPLLAGIYLVGDLESALEQGTEYPHCTFVTASGDLVTAGGIVSGGSPETAGPGIISKKREIRELSQEVTALGAAITTLEESRTRLKGAMTAAEEEGRELRQQLHQSELRLVNLQKDLQRAREEQQRTQERLAIQQLEDDQLTEERETLEQEIRDSSRGREEREGRKQEIEQRVEELRTALESRKEELTRTRDLVTTLKVRSASLKEKREANRRAVKRLEELLRDQESRMAGHRRQLAEGETDRVRLELEIGENDRQLKRLLLESGTLESRLSSAREGYQRLAERVREEDILLKGLRSSCEELRRTVAQKGLALSELAMRMEHLEQSVADRYRVNLRELVPHYREKEWDDEELRRRQTGLQKQVDEMGEVNLTAIDEYRELEERFAFLSSQKADLEESLNGLQQAIQKINRTTRKRFYETFNLVNAKFQELFPRLFRGGHAELRLTNEEDLLETGIEIIVQPPGKKLQNVTLLSGGEKALTALSLVFAIFLIKPSPFCLLDEVDAPLDDANIGRFNEMVREMSAISQFIVITHNKGTMAVADTLYGITMEEPGMSKMVSVKLN
jgi:chromosome segregation protein